MEKARAMCQRRWTRRRAWPGRTPGGDTWGVGRRSTGRREATLGASGGDARGVGRLAPPRAEGRR
ncbi:unnamed protein product [Spirodela intermedia]|uniref:Uncharacterized protein n=1 Tax=Spirodela intermedia TaxID=51605 RepID=A0A7I8L918_SPIIN|nr:unnamed protein product [Spirodela intermedia]